MIDDRLRPLKDRALEPLATRLAGHVAPLPITLVSLATGLGAAVTAGAGHVWWSVVLWLTCRVADGLDGAVARRRGASSDLGGYLDLLADTVVYAAVPLGIASALDERAGWIAVAVLLGVLYLNTVSWAVLSALLEKRRGSVVGGPTSVRLPTGVIEGAETIVLYTLMLAIPERAVWWFVAMTALVGATVVWRAVGAARTTLNDHAISPSSASSSHARRAR